MTTHSTSTHICVSMSSLLLLFMSVAILSECFTAIVNRYHCHDFWYERNFSIHRRSNRNTTEHLSWFSFSLSLFRSLYDRGVSFLPRNYSIKMWQSANKRSSLSTQPQWTFILHSSEKCLCHTHTLHQINARIIKYETSFHKWTVDFNPGGNWYSDDRLCLCLLV